MSIVERALKKLQHSRETEADVPELAAYHGTRPSMAVAAGHAADERGAEFIPPAAAPRSDRVVTVNRAVLRTSGMLPPEHQERQLADEYRQIKRPLIANAIGKGVPKLANGHLVMMASALPGEGKTFTTINLALSMALEQDISVLLVDADVAKPHISRIFGLSDQPGLLDALLDETLDAESLIVPTDVPRLSILPAGRRVADTATELLTSVRMEQTVARIGANNPRRIALIDSPPLLLTSESRALATVVGQVVLVVRAGSTSQQTVLDAISYLGEGKSIGVVLNQSDESAPGSYYGYGAYGDMTGGSGAESGWAARK